MEPAPELLWSPEHLHAELGKPGLAIIDTRPAELFAAGRIPGARHFDPYFVNCDDTDPKPLASFTRMWANMLGWRGVKSSDTIVFYGAFTDMCAARCLWFLRSLFAVESWGLRRLSLPYAPKVSHFRCFG